MLPQGHVTNDNIGKDIQSRLHSSSTATDRGLGDKIMPTSNALQTTVVADDEVLYRRGIFGLPLKGDACHARLVKEIEVFVWDEEFYSAIVIYLALGLYRDGIANGIESHGKGDDDKRDDHRTGSHKDWGHLADDAAHLLAPQFYVVCFIIVVVHISKSLLVVIAIARQLGESWRRSSVPQLQLVLHKIVVRTALCRQRLVVARLDDLAVVDDDNLVGIPDRAQAVGDDDDGMVRSLLASSELVASSRKM